MAISFYYNSKLLYRVYIFLGLYLHKVRNLFIQLSNLPTCVAVVRNTSMLRYHDFAILSIVSRGANENLQSKCRISRQYCEASFQLVSAAAYFKCVGIYCLDTCS